MLSCPCWMLLVCTLCTDYTDFTDFTDFTVRCVARLPTHVPTTRLTGCPLSCQHCIETVNYESRSVRAWLYCRGCRYM